MEIAKFKFIWEKWWEGLFLPRVFLIDWPKIFSEFPCSYLKAYLCIFAYSPKAVEVISLFWPQRNHLQQLAKSIFAFLRFIGDWICKTVLILVLCMIAHYCRFFPKISELLFILPKMNFYMTFRVKHFFFLIVSQEGKMT